MKKQLSLALPVLALAIIGLLVIYYTKKQETVEHFSFAELWCAFKGCGTPTGCSLQPLKCFGCPACETKKK